MKHFFLKMIVPLTALFFVVIGVRGEISDSLERGIGEPFLWLEGVSVWPSLTIRFSAFILMIVLILIFWFKLEKEAQKISEDFGFPRPRPYSRVRSWWTAAWFGHNVEPRFLRIFPLFFLSAEGTTNGFPCAKYPSIGRKRELHN